MEVTMTVSAFLGRPLRGGRGLKYPRGSAVVQNFSRPLRGGRGLKYASGAVIVRLVGRPLRGGRGLKYPILYPPHVCRRVAPFAGDVD